MKKKVLKRILTGAIAIVMIFAFSSCTVIQLVSLIFGNLFNDTPELTLEYTLTQEDLDEFNGLADKCEELGMQGTNPFGLSSAMMDMNALIEYINAQSTIGYLEYCMDQTDPTALAHYEESETMYTSVRTRYLALLKKLAQESPIKDELFGDWSEEERKMLLVDHEKIGEIQLSM